MEHCCSVLPSRQHWQMKNRQPGRLISGQTVTLIDCWNECRHMKATWTDLLCMLFTVITWLWYISCNTACANCFIHSHILPFFDHLSSSLKELILILKIIQITYSFILLTLLSFLCMLRTFLVLFGWFFWLSHCWLGIRKSIQPVKILSDEVLLAWLSVWSKMQMIFTWSRRC